ncbi:hypothetical protein [Chthoniobacter flavus]|uniref:hypothetical protein n=1 Tax=Chthoniobacter flavus TaxID=191863 RepID=UPI00031FC463|nr:hypothetical protein [Chthoniobacter flavus]
MPTDSALPLTRSPKSGRPAIFAAVETHGARFGRTGGGGASLSDGKAHGGQDD